MRGQPTTPETFWPMVAKTDSEPDTCWEYQGYKRPDGYGEVSYHMQKWPAHRLAWLFTYGPIPDELWVLHKCDNRICCRPSHLWLGTNQDNVDDMVSKQRHSFGAAHYSRREPQRLARGNRSGARLHPETRPRGDMHPSRLHPECLVRGEDNSNAKLTAADVRLIRQYWDSKTFNGPQLAAMFGVDKTNISCIVLRKTWTHIL